RFHGRQLRGIADADRPFGWRAERVESRDCGVTQLFSRLVQSRRHSFQEGRDCAGTNRCASGAGSGSAECAGAKRLALTRWHGEIQLSNDSQLPLNPDLAFGFHSPDKQRSLLAESSKLRGIAKPASFVLFGNGSRIRYAVVLYLREPRLGEKLGPFAGRKQMRRDGQNVSPLMRMHVLAVIIDENPGRPAFAKHAMDFA